MKRSAIESSVAPTLTDLWDDPEVQRKLPSADDLEDEISHATLRPKVPNYQDFSAAIYKNVNRALRGSLTPKKALTLANLQMDQALAASPSR
jgi:multiple sugar transport system substrate-binding protein